MLALWALSQTQMTDLPFHIPEGHYREYPPGGYSIAVKRLLSNKRLVSLHHSLMFLQNLQCDCQ